MTKLPVNDGAGHVVRVLQQAPWIEEQVARTEDLESSVRQAVEATGAASRRR